MTAIPTEDVGARLARALGDHAAAAGVTVRASGWRTRPWWSATFDGHRHTATIEVDGEGAAAWIATLDEAELPIRGHLLADLTVTADGDQHRLSALTVIEA